MVETRFSQHEIITLDDGRELIVIGVDVTTDGKTISYELDAYDTFEGVKSDKRHWIGDHQIKRVTGTNHYRFVLEFNDEMTNHLFDALKHIDKAVASLSDEIIEHIEVDRVFIQLRALVQPERKYRDDPDIEKEGRV